MLKVMMRNKEDWETGDDKQKHQVVGVVTGVANT